MVFILKKDTPCKDCESTYHPCQMDIVRKNGDKSVQLSKVLHKSRKFLIEELSLCDVVCANCNRLRTWNFQRQNRKDA